MNPVDMKSKKRPYPQGWYQGIPKQHKKIFEPSIPRRLGAQDAMFLENVWDEIGSRLRAEPTIDSKSNLLRWMLWSAKWKNESP